MSEQSISGFGYVLRVFLILFVLLFGIPVVLWALLSIVDDFRISINQETARARVWVYNDDWEERNDGRTMVHMFYFGYEFEVEGKKYSGQGQSQGEPPPDEITIAYDKKQPDNNRVKNDSFYRYTAPLIKLIGLVVIAFFAIRFLLDWLRECFEKVMNTFASMASRVYWLVLSLCLLGVLFFIIGGAASGDAFTGLGYFVFPYRRYYFFICLVTAFSLYIGDAIAINIERKRRRIRQTSDEDSHP